MAQALPSSSRGVPHVFSDDLAAIPDAFRKVAAEHPDRVAYQHDDRSLTYREVDQASNRIANHLLAWGDTTKPLVVIAPLAIDSALVILGALKAGQLVVPLDPRWPSEKWAEVVRQTGGGLAVPNAATRDLLGPHVVGSTLTFAELSVGDDHDPQVSLDSRAPAFVFFTSGSTGAPKGIVVGHATALRTLDMFDVKIDARVALLAPLGFITGAMSAVAILLTGGSGSFFDLGSQDLGQLLDWIDRNRITIIGLTPTVIGVIAHMAIDEGRTLDSLEHVGHGGEAGTAQHFEDARRAFPNANLRHSYGLTETGSVAGHDLDDTLPTPGEAVPVGHPWPWLEVRIVDDDGTDVPTGEPGEIWVTGRSLALEYWNEPILTAERFVDHGDGTRTVRTGDRGRLRDDGMLVHLGRMDRRVKIHGQFVDLVAIEHEFRDLDGVRDAVVSAVPTADGGHRVVAHVVVAPDATVTVGDLRRELGQRLPSYMIPRTFFRIDAVPQTVNGKVDRVWLRDSTIDALPLDTAYVAPRDAQEETLGRLFAESLGVERVGIHDDFFDLGGDSLSVLDLLAGIRESFDTELTPDDLLLDATVVGVASRLRSSTPSDRRILVPVAEGDGHAVFCVPGAAGTPLQYRALAKRLGDRAVFAFAYRGMRHRAPADRTVARIARRNVAAMQTQDPHGPYTIGGYSFGGAVALEMARQLEGSGYEAGLVFLLEPTLFTANDSRIEPVRATASDRAQEHPPGTDGRAGAARARALARRGYEFVHYNAWLASAGLVIRRGQRQHDVFYALQVKLGPAHATAPFAGAVLVFGSEGYFDLYRPLLDRLMPPVAAGGRRRDIVVPGAHLDLVREPNVGEVARVLGDTLAANAAQT